MMKKIIYIGNSYEMVQILLSSMIFELEAVICEAKKYNQKIHELPLHDTGIFPVETVEDIRLIMGNLGKIAVMYDFGIIITKDIVSRHIICNFHPGDLRKNRGSSPIHWSVLLGETTTKMSLYQISEKIDSGKLFCEREVEIKDYDTPNLLRKKLESEIPSMLPELDRYLDGGIEPVEVRDGIYRKRITEEDYTIHTDVDSVEEVKNKIRSQDGYKGAIVLCRGGGRHYVRTYDEYLKLINSFSELRK